MNEDVPVVLKDLPPHVHGFVCLGSDYNPCIIINARLSVEEQRKTYRHEMEHILTGQIFDDDYVEYERTETKTKVKRKRAGLRVSAPGTKNMDRFRNN